MKKFMEDWLDEDAKLKKRVETIRRQMSKKNTVEEVVEAWQLQQSEYETVSAAFLIRTSDEKLWTTDILGSKTSIHVFNELSRFSSFRKSSSTSVQAGSLIIPILGYGLVRVPIIFSNQFEGVIWLHHVAYCVDFVSNLVSVKHLKDKEIEWDTEIEMLFKRVDQKRKFVCQIF